MVLILLGVHLSFAILLFFLILAFVTGAPYVPTTTAAADAMIRLANIKKGNTVVDLGSGDGKLLLLAARAGASQAIGYEINPYLVLLSRVRALAYRTVIRVSWRNFWRADLSNAGVVFVYLLPWRMETLGKKLRRELAPGALVVSNSFVFPNWRVVRQDEKQHIYVFRV